MCFQIKQSAEIVTNLNVTRNTWLLNQISGGQNGDVKIHTDHGGTMYGPIHKISTTWTFWNSITQISQLLWRLHAEPKHGTDTFRNGVKL